MFKLLQSAALIACCVFAAFVSSGASSSAPHVELKRVPEGGIQPQTAVGEDGTVHLVYFKGDPSEGDLFYARSKDGVTFSDPIRVNSLSGTAVEAELPLTSKAGCMCFGMLRFPGIEEKARDVSGWRAPRTMAERLNRNAVCGISRREPVVAARLLHLLSNRAGSTFCSALLRK